MTIEVRHVDDLADPQVDGDAAQQVGLDRVEPVLAAEPVDHPPDRVAGRGQQVRARSRRWRSAGPIGSSAFGSGAARNSGPGDVDVLAHGEADRRPHRRLDGGPADLAVALRRVAVADREPGARHEDRQEQRRAGDEVAGVHVAAVDVGRDRAAAAR